MTGNMHIYSESMQPATRWVDIHSGDTHNWPANTPLFAHCCNKLRTAKSCVVQAYYDQLAIWCAPGKGCKSKKEIAAKAKREFTNRSSAQKARRKREKK